MKRFTFRLYTEAEILTAAVPFLIDGHVNLVVPKQPGVYFLLNEYEQLYIRILEPSLNGNYHLRSGHMKGLTLAERAKQDAAIMQEVVAAIQRI